ncbi:type II secretion system F family protein [Desulfosoma caldarium]|uniref:Type IV pilus assembly protein PilC n=1 Tax=Desulfosoma caldarium TaxID=610254 RepID=A0A3N1VJ51_9BACT|nr:type II secretion system F family protein [Desulfosoma caldarium]ROR01950.1 type IV pilus assembly protein PilC [Desulfosoma caldarium]
MPEFIYKGINRKGQKVRGEIEADNLTIARQLLERQGLSLKALKPKPKDLLEYIPVLQEKVKEKDLVLFTRQFSTMIDAGLPIIQCLEILRDQTENKAFRKVLRALKKDVEEGATFSEALRKHPKVFDQLFVNLVAAGEAGGILDVTLTRLAAYLEKVASLKKKVRGAMTYPAIVVAIAVIVIAVILVYVIPVFAGLFRDAGVSLPALTLVVMNVSDFAKNYFHWMILGLVVLGVLFARFRKTRRGRDVTDRLFLKVPVFGLLIKKVALARVTRTLGTMLGSGVPILESMELVAATAGNAVIEKAIREAKQAVSQGRTLSEPLAESGIFPPMVVHMVSVGEATGALDSMLSKVADFYDEEVDATVEALTSLLEPMLIVFLGVTIGGLLVAMYMPIFQLADVVSRGT